MTISTGDYRSHGDGGYELYTGEVNGWIICDDWHDLQNEIQLLEQEKPDIGNGDLCDS